MKDFKALEKKISDKCKEIVSIEESGLNFDEIEKEEFPTTIECSECLSKFITSELIKFLPRRDFLKCPLCQLSFIEKADIAKIHKLRSEIISLESEIQGAKEALRNELGVKINQALSILERTQGHGGDTSIEIYNSGDLSLSFTNYEIFSHNEHREDRDSYCDEILKQLNDRIQSVFPDSEILILSHKKHSGTIVIKNPQL